MLLLCLGSRGALAQNETVSRADDPGTPSATAVRTDAVFQIDAVLDEADWQSAEPITGLIQFEPTEGAPESQRTEVRILYGEAALYVGAVLYDEHPDLIEMSLGRRDDFNRADWFLISIDSYFDKKTAYTFGVNAGGVQFDAIQTGARRGPSGTGNAPNQMDPSWDAIWDVSRRVTSQGWVVEMRIPYSMLRFSDAPRQTWGVQISRFIPRLGEQSEWPHVPRTDRGNLVSYFGHLTGIRDVEPRGNLQVTPYSVARMRSSESVDTPGSLDRVRDLDVGGDVKMGFGPNVTLDATLNPDFGQVEADPAVLNLTAFETPLVERRPFFIEGMQIYQFDLGPGRLPYTRRIGGAAPIIGAAKLSGRSAGGLSFGVLGAATGDNLDPSRFYGLARMSQQIGNYSSVGGIVTGFDGERPDVSGRRRSVIAGMDYDFRFVDNAYGVEGFATVTHRYWTPTGPEARTGHGGKVLVAKRQGVLNGFTGVEGFSDLAYYNDWGRVQENNFVSLFLRFEYNLNGGRPFGPFQRASIGDFGSQKFSYSDGLDQGQRHSINSNWTLRSLQEIQLGTTISRPFGGYDIFETRGLGPWARPPSVEYSGAYTSDVRRSWQLGPTGSIRFDDDDGRAYGLGLEGNWTAGSRIELSGTLEGEWEDEVTAWMSNESLLRAPDRWLIGTRSASPDVLGDGDYVEIADAGGLDAVMAGVDRWADDLYYVSMFGARDTRSIDLTLRGAVTFRPNLSLQIYGQFFVARGRYDTFQIQQNRDDLAAFDAYPKRDNFVFSRLQSNTVLRWEYRPGSTLFLVWTHGRRSDDALNPLGPWTYSPYDRPIGDQIGDTFDVLPDNTILVKLNYAFLR
ncbi:MAG: DUF5916 domain-containing protein [Rhodothermales bacterium]